MLDAVAGSAPIFRMKIGIDAPKIPLIKQLPAIARKTTKLSWKATGLCCIFGSNALISAEPDSVAIEFVSPVLAMMNEIGAMDYRLARPDAVAFTYRKWLNRLTRGAEAGHRPPQRRLETGHCLLYGDWGTSKAYVIGLAFVAAEFFSFPIILAVCTLTAVVGYNYIIVCSHS
jgi:hypothetical protein